MECSIAIQVLPLDKHTDDEVCFVVDKVIAYIAQSNLDYLVSPFETVIQGSYESCMEVLKGCQLVAAEAGCGDMITMAKINFRPAGSIMTTERKLSNYRSE